MNVRIIGDIGFVEDVRPLFSDVDVDHMQRFLDLSSWEDTRDQVDIIIQRLEDKSMPPGGWPDEKIEIVTKWKLDDCPKWKGQKYYDFFVDLDAHTEYWDVYGRDPSGQYMAGIKQYLPLLRNQWFDYAEFKNQPVGIAALETLKMALVQEQFKDNLLMTDNLMKMLIYKHFTDSTSNLDVVAYFDAIERFATDSFQLDNYRNDLITDPNDFRNEYARYHRMDGEKLWFVWAGQCEWSSMIDNNQSDLGVVRRLQMAGAVYGVCLDFTFRSDRSAKAKNIPAVKEFNVSESTKRGLRKQAMQFFNDFESAKAEIHRLYQIYQQATV